MLTAMKVLGNSARSYMEVDSLEGYMGIHVDWRMASAIAENLFPYDSKAQSDLFNNWLKGEWVSLFGLRVYLEEDGLE